MKSKIKILQNNSLGSKSVVAPRLAPPIKMGRSRTTSLIKKIVSVLSPLALFLPLTAFAQDAVRQGLSIPGFSVLFGGGGLAGETSLKGLIIDVIGLLLFFAGSIAVLFVIIGGFWYITASGNEEQAEKGRKALVNAIIGIIVIALSYAIIRVVQNTIGGN